MSEKDVVENVDSPGEIAIPYADNSTPGIASFDSNDFTVGPDGKVSSIVERGIPQYLGKITGTGIGTTDLNWEVDWKSRPTIVTKGEEEVDKAKRIKLGEYIMLTEHFNQFMPGDIFRITSVQIDGSNYTVKTNNVKALSLASIVGPQGEQGEEGAEGVPYLAYTNSIESTADPAPGNIMRLEDGHFNRTPIATSAEYQDVVTVDWYNSTTHKAFMVTGYIQSKDSATNQWVAQITAAIDITGAVGPQGKEGAGIADIIDIDYPHGEFTSVQYDTTDGIKMQGIAKYLRDDGETYQIPTDIDVPLVAGNGILIDKKENEEKVEIKIDPDAISGGEAVTPSTATPTATSGTFTSTEWAKLQANNNNYILFNNEIYRLADKAHSGTTGIWSYTHTGWDGTAIMDKSINVTVATGAWTLVTGQASGGGKLYLHTITLMGTLKSATIRFITDSSNQVTSLNSIPYGYFVSGYISLTRGSTKYYIVSEISNTRVSEYDYAPDIIYYPDDTMAFESFEGADIVDGVTEL